MHHCQAELGKERLSTHCRRLGHLLKLLVAHLYHPDQDAAAALQRGFVLQQLRDALVLLRHFVLQL